MAAILLYHAVADQVVDERLQVRPATIDRHLSWFVDLGYELATLAEALSHSAERRVALAFDDGFASVELAGPVLRAWGVRPTIFICPGWVGGENDWASPGRVRGRLLDETATRRLSVEGASFGCHGWDHRPFVGRTEVNMEADLARCAEWFLRTMGARPAVFAWPFGEFDPVATQVVARYHGYALAAGRVRAEEVTRWTVPRIAATEGLGIEAFEERLDLGSFCLG
jgi:peptidoglycan/xylan/chitin deacetylase (PgdA/CDA1 family)